jgi:ribonuclease HII
MNLDSDKIKMDPKIETIDPKIETIDPKIETIDPKIENMDLKKKEVKVKKVTNCLKKSFLEDPSIYEIGVDEVGRGPLFGRVYTAAVILPKDDSFDHSKMKDSKKFHNKKKIEEVAEYIRQNAIAYYISYEDEKVIDEINILQATQKSMRSSIMEVRKQLLCKNAEKREPTEIHLLIDGNYFIPITLLNKETNRIETIPYNFIEGGDNKYSAIAAASILAKVERDKYIEDLCIENPELVEKYSLDTNKGYGAKKHLDGIKEHGITIWHRRTFGICSTFS